MLIFYNVFVRAAFAATWLAQFFNKKAADWLAGQTKCGMRNAEFGMLRAQTNNSSSITHHSLWVHCASLGEFEQGRPVLEAFRQKFPDWKIVLTFFSPSGFDKRKDWPGADFITYLPLDTPRNARRFLDQIRPDLAIFVKYEFWPNHLFELKRRGISTLLVSGIFRKNQPFFWPVGGGFWREMLGCFTHFFVQNEESAELLTTINFKNSIVSGDTRIDRVIEIVNQNVESKTVQTFLKPEISPVFIAGSSWPADEEIFFPVLARPEFQSFKIIVAPHEISEKRLAEIADRFRKTAPSGEAGAAVFYSKFDGQFSNARLLVIDNIGLLNTIYRYGSVAFIGGGFGAGIHNLLEPAAFGLPVIFGPRFQKFEEARQLIESGGAFSIKNQEELAAVLRRLVEADFYENASRQARRFIETNRGATEKIIDFIEAVIIGRHSI